MTLTEGESLVVAGTASDAEDGVLTAALQWSSDLDGVLGSGGSLSVVLSVGTQPPAQSKATAEQLGIELNPYGFCQTDKFAPLETSQPGVYVCGAFQSPKEIAETIIDAAGAAGDVMRLMRADLGKAKSSREYPFISIPSTAATAAASRECKR